jgi:hypothetical protein
MSRLKIGILKDENFQVGNHKIKMLKVGPHEFTLEIQGAMNQQFDIGPQPVEILPGISVTAGVSEHFIPQNKDYSIRRAVVVIEAPQEVIIHRFKGVERFAA